MSIDHGYIIFTSSKKCCTQRTNSGHNYIMKYHEVISEPIQNSILNVLESFDNMIIPPKSSCKKERKKPPQMRSNQKDRQKKPTHNQNPAHVSFYFRVEISRRGRCSTQDYSPPCGRFKTGCNCLWKTATWTLCS